MHVALDGGEHDLALGPPAVRPALAQRLFLLGLHERLEVGHRALHRPGALDHLRQEHPSRPEQVAHDLHAVHQRPLDHIERALGEQPGLLGVGLDEVDDAVHEGMGEPLLDRRLAPGQVDFAPGARAPHGIGEDDQPVGGIRAPVEDDVLDQLEQVGGEVLVDGELAGVDDPHVQPGADRVKQEGRVHGLAHHVVAAKRERQVGDAAG